MDETQAPKKRADKASKRWLVDVGVKKRTRLKSRIIFSKEHEIDRREEFGIPADVVKSSQ